MKRKDHSMIIVAYEEMKENWKTEYTPFCLLNLHGQ